MLSSFYKNSNLFKFTAKSTESRSDYRGIHSSTPPNDGNDSPDWVQEFRLSGIPDRLTLANVAWIDGPEAVQILTEEAIARCQKVSSYLTKPAQEILNRYEFAEAGGWVVEGTTLTGDRGAVPYFKPDRPRQITELKGFGQAPKIKTIKYETPQGMEAEPLLPCVTWEFGLKIARNISKKAENSYVQRFQEFVRVQSITTIEADRNRKQWRPRGVDSVFLRDVATTCWIDSGELDCTAGGRIDRALCSTDRTFWLWHQSTTGRIAITEGYKKALAW